MGEERQQPRMTGETTASEAHPYHDARWTFKKRRDVHTARTGHAEAVEGTPAEHRDGYYIPTLEVYPHDDADREAIDELAAEHDPTLVEVEPPHAGDRVVFVAEGAADYVETER